MLYAGHSGLIVQSFIFGIIILLTTKAIAGDADDQVMREFNKVASELGRGPTWAQFAARAAISADVALIFLCSRLRVSVFSPCLRVSG